MKQSDEVQEMNHQGSICAFQEYQGYEQEEKQNKNLYDKLYPSGTDFYEHYSKFKCSNFRLI